MRVWAYKNADEKAHTFLRRSKNVKKRTKTYEKRILCKFTFILALSCSSQSMVCEESKAGSHQDSSNLIKETFSFYD